MQSVLKSGVLVDPPPYFDHVRKVEYSWRSQKIVLTILSSRSYDHGRLITHTL